ncbi:MAG: hypothetical protein IKC09_03580 [Oscillospiraceae bacterium]|nr:hypothetical protein [Oscillospiraceae bacterium]
MKSRTLSCEQTVLVKDITRFAPSWILYSIFLLLMVMVTGSSDDVWITASIRGTTAFSLAIINIIYGLINAQLLFGDLFQSRMTNALHALPLRREGWFVTHLASGTLFALVPNLAYTLVMMLSCGEIPNLPWLWLLTAMGQYLFFFGLGIFCMVCVGSRFAGVVVYGLVNFGSLLVLWMMEELYVPLLPSVLLVENNFLRFCPVVWATMNIPYEMNIGKMEQLVTVSPEGMTYLGILAALGLVLLVLGLLLYRVRQLESAGDFLAVPWLKPVFLVMYSLMLGVGCQWILGGLTGSDWIYLIIGLLIGYFTGQMLLMRTTRILTKKTFMGLAVLLGGLGLSLWITWLDPLGIKAWVPEPEQVSKISLNYQETDDPKIIEQIINLHSDLVIPEDVTVYELDPEDWVLVTDYERVNAVSILIEYTMKDGSQAGRYYVTSNGTHIAALRKILSHPDFVIGDLLDIWDEAWIHTTVEDGEGKDIYLSREKWAELKEVLLKDCEAGTMAQSYNVHNNMSPVYWLHIQYREGEHYIWYNINVFPDSENTLSWLKQQSFYEEYTGK